MTTGGAPTDEYTYDLGSVEGGPRRPSYADLGGDQYHDDDPAPDKSEMPYAAIFNEKTRQIVGLCRLSPLAIVWVRLAGTVATVEHVESMGTQITIHTFTIGRNSIGEYQLSWPASTLPAPVANTRLAMHAAGFGWSTLTSSLTALISTRDTTGAAADLSFSVAIH